LAEIAVVVGILAILLVIAVPAYFRYRGHTAVNTAAEVTEGLLVRAREDAKASGFALPEPLRTNGVPTAAPAGPFGVDGTVTVRVRKRYRAGEPAQTLTSKDLSMATPISVEVVGLGTIDIDAQNDLEGVYFEILVKSGATATVLATIPIEVNGEMIFAGDTGEGAIRLSYQDYQRTITVSHRGVINPDRR
jgi:type II secretory pathway pseudopilin PulG